jgi:hypothetical protein
LIGKGSVTAVVNSPPRSATIVSLEHQIQTNELDRDAEATIGGRPGDLMTLIRFRSVSDADA